MATTAAVLALAAGGTIATTGAAYASEGDGTCSSGEVCMYWGPNYTGAMITFYYNKYSHRWWYFPNNGTGGGQAIWHNVASVWNSATKSPVSICRYENYAGPVDRFGAQRGGNLTSTRNLNESHKFDSGG
jgi:hypothetical protein